MRFKFQKNPEKAPKLGSLYGQDVEPTGYYVTELGSFLPNGWISGEAELKNPLYILVNNETLVDWKYKLSDRFNKKGKRLTNFLIQRGYDGIVTRFKDGTTGEIIIFNPEKSIIELPFTEKIEEGYHIRTFNSTLDESELKWHYDEEDRIVVCEDNTDWLFQMDNELPVKINRNTPIFIPEGQYHRIIKGCGDLTVKVKKINNKKH